ncbi:MAG: hypothetical protein QNJ92_12565 [Alphaproteobacteria bacterium]|nr:hypothetical protein [Alphaproteobacteria bacterium]
MISTLTRSLSGVAAIAALLICHPVYAQPADYGKECDFDVGDGPDEPELLKKYINRLPPNGQRARALLQDGPALARAIEEMENQALEQSDKRGSKLGDKIEEIEKSRFARGLAGVSVRSFLTAAKHTLDGGRFKHAIRFFETIGQLEAFHFVENGESCLRVRMTTTATRRNGKRRSVTYIWTVFLPFSVAVRDDTDPSNVFPTAMTVQVSAAMASNFDRKLWAKGDSVRITRVERERKNGTLKLLPANHPLYETTPESCVDMMFKGLPPETLPDGTTPPFYCLGRCENPPIINTK